MTNKLTREEALEILKIDPYNGNEHNLKQDLEYFLKKMNWDIDELQAYLERKEVNHYKFGSDLDKKKLVAHLQKILYVIKNPVRIIKKRIFGIKT